MYTTLIPGSVKPGPSDAMRCNHDTGPGQPAHRKQNGSRRQYALAGIQSGLRFQNDFCLPSPSRMVRVPVFRKHILLAFVLTLQTGSVAAAGGTAPETMPDLESAAARAEAWIATHPATQDDGGINDIIDEGVSLYIRHNLATGATEHARYTAELREHMARLEQMPAFRKFAGEQHRRLIDVYHLVLAAYMARSAGKPFADEPAIAERARQSLMTTPYCGPTVRLTVATLLDYLGGQQVLDLGLLRESGGIARLALPPSRPLLPGADDPAASRITAFHFYAIVHEVIVLTDFSRRPVPAWLEAHRDILVKELRTGVRWAQEQAQYDLLAELLITLRMLDVAPDKELRDAIVALAQAQQADGTWGESATTNRQNRVRHTVLTGAQALWMYNNVNP